ncbi:hypothetical protein LOTGIDRAFT_203701 [Lottia gigantea]|uniref:Methyltransferase type 11 domain-containing protein n=1 Tax=Lottia gigantea TaxID=225164 RepID=V4ATF8_LOTGI|nr:hypothetical protein LOTGIDRAFT_203701 [Lottia gigantea]ESO98185.1 hypothetical protein LOTGIDRAFT_203701 [Lottia gigantea]
MSGNRDNTRLDESERKKIFQQFHAKSQGDEHDIWECQKFRASLNSTEVIGIFDEWVKNGDGSYEKDMLGIGYQGHYQTAELLSKHLPGKKDQYKIIDCGAGSGLSGVELKKVGFSHIDWLDPSGLSVEPAKKRKVYERFIVDYLSEKALDVKPDTYDASTCVAAFFEGLIPLGGFNEMIRITKPGGIIILSISETSLNTCKEYKGRFLPRLEELIEAKEWELVEKTHEPHYYRNVPAFFFVMRVLRSGPIQHESKVTK